MPDMRFLMLGILVVCGAVLGGCATPNATDPYWSHWAAQHGGLLADPAKAERAQALCNTLCAGTFETPLRVHILAPECCCAYAFPAGDVFVTRGLLDSATDQQLAAALAHEMGHLLHDNHGPEVVALRGFSPDADIEVQADALGCEVLAAHGIPPSAMSDMLRLVSATNPGCRGEIARRIEILAHNSSKPK